VDTVLFHGKAGGKLDNLFQTVWFKVAVQEKRIRDGNDAERRLSLKRIEDGMVYELDTANRVTDVRDGEVPSPVFQ